MFQDDIDEDALLGASDEDVSGDQIGVALIDEFDEDVDEVLLEPADDE